MAVASFKKKNVPFLLGGNGELVVDTGSLQLNQQLPETTTSVLNVGFQAGGSHKLALGRDDSIKLGISTSASAKLTATFASTRGEGAKLLAENGLGSYFQGGANADKVVVGLDLGGSGALSASGSFSYSALKANVEVDAGADGGYTYLRALDKNAAHSGPALRLLRKDAAAGARRGRAGAG